MHLKYILYEQFRPLCEIVTILCLLEDTTLFMRHMTNNVELYIGIVQLQELQICGRWL